MAVEVSDDNVASFLRLLLTGENSGRTNEDRPRKLALAYPAAVGGQEYVGESAFLVVAGGYPQRLGSELEDPTIRVEYPTSTIVGGRWVAIESALAADIASVSLRALKALMARLLVDKLPGCSVEVPSTVVPRSAAAARHHPLVPFSKTVSVRRPATASSNDGVSVPCGVLLAGNVVEFLRPS
ncbi:hypothetical protein ACIBF5_32245 [Micromonospora sp. NPDC050417]|uniref:hypothetical protein n=1 Tax=Micromonospora sp. NPDC050417 TaxID=3364280 RepID=UPI0037A8146B